MLTHQFHGLDCVAVQRERQLFDDLGTGLRRHRDLKLERRRVEDLDLELRADLTPHGTTKTFHTYEDMGERVMSAHRYPAKTPAKQRDAGSIWGTIESTYPPSTRTAAPVVADARGELR